MRPLALTWLHKELKKARIDLAHAEARQRNDDERRNLQTKINIIEYLIEEITREGPTC